MTGRSNWQSCVAILPFLILQWATGGAEAADNAFLRPALVDPASLTRLVH